MGSSGETTRRREDEQGAAHHYYHLRSHSFSSLFSSSFPFFNPPWAVEELSCEKQQLKLHTGRYRGQKRAVICVASSIKEYYIYYISVIEKSINLALVFK